MHIDAQTLKPREAYAWLTSLLVPRPIAWVTTQTAEGHKNLAPFSFFQGLCSDPPMVTLSIAHRRDGTLKDTARIAEATGVLCINSVEAQHLEVMNATSADEPAEVSEVDKHGIATVPCHAIAGVRVAQARVALECRLVERREYGRQHKTSLLVCEVVHLYVDDAILAANQTAPVTSAFAPISRLGGHDYAAIGPRTTLPRP